jgi:hypothetical protein
MKLRLKSAMERWESWGLASWSEFSTSLHRSSGFKVRWSQITTSVPFLDRYGGVG